MFLYDNLEIQGPVIIMNLISEKQSQLSIIDE